MSQFHKVIGVGARGEGHGWALGVGQGQIPSCRLGVGLLPAEVQWCNVGHLDRAWYGYKRGGV